MELELPRWNFPEYDKLINEDLFVLLQETPNARRYFKEWYTTHIDRDINYFIDLGFILQIGIFLAFFESVNLHLVGTPHGYSISKSEEVSDIYRSIESYHYSKDNVIIEGHFRPLYTQGIDTELPNRNDWLKYGIYRGMKLIEQL